MGRERLKARYVEAMRYLDSPESDAFRALYVESDHYGLCFGYVIWTAETIRPGKIEDTRHRRAYEAARKAYGDVHHVDVPTVRQADKKDERATESSVPGSRNAGAHAD